MSRRSLTAEIVASPQATHTRTHACTPRSTHTRNALPFSPANQLLRADAQQPRKGVVGVGDAARGVQRVEEGERVRCLLHQLLEHLWGKGGTVGVWAVGRLSVCARPTEAEQHGSIPACSRTGGKGGGTRMQSQLTPNAPPTTHTHNETEKARTHARTHAPPAPSSAPGTAGTPYPCDPATAGCTRGRWRGAAVRVRRVGGSSDAHARSFLCEQSMLFLCVHAW